MKTIKRNIPNFITILNLVCGISSIIVLFKYELIYSGILIFAGAIFDLADGLLARALNATSEIGKQLDSFADMVGITKLVTARTVKIRNIAKQTQTRSLKSPLAKITRRPDSVSTKNC